MARIAAYEETRRQPWPLYAIGGLGALTVVLGLLAIIAANWADIGGLAKIGADFLLLLALAFGILRADAAGSACKHCRMEPAKVASLVTIGRSAPPRRQSRRDPHP